MRGHPCWFVKTAMRPCSAKKRRRKSGRLSYSQHVPHIQYPSGRNMHHTSNTAVAALSSQAVCFKCVVKIASLTGPAAPQSAFSSRAMCIPVRTASSLWHYHVLRSPTGRHLPVQTYTFESLPAQRLCHKGRSPAWIDVFDACFCSLTIPFWLFS